MNNYPNQYPLQSPVSPVRTSVVTPINNTAELNLLWGALKTGAMVGATGATALGIQQITSQQADKKEVMKNIAKTTATVGIATGAAVAVGTLLKKQPALSLLATFVTGTAVMYALNKSQAQPLEVKDDE